MRSPTCRWSTRLTTVPTLCAPTPKKSFLGGQKFQLTQHLGTEVHKTNTELKRKRKAHQIMLEEALGAKKKHPWVFKLLYFQWMKWTRQAVGRILHFFLSGLKSCTRSCTRRCSPLGSRWPRWRTGYLHDFLEKNTGKTIPTEETLWTKYITMCYKEVLNGIEEGSLWANADYTRDAQGHEVPNVVVGKLDSSTSPSLSWWPSWRLPTAAPCPTSSMTPSGSWTRTLTATGSASSSVMLRPACVSAGGIWRPSFPASFMSPASSMESPSSARRRWGLPRCQPPHCCLQDGVCKGTCLSRRLPWKLPWVSPATWASLDSVRHVAQGSSLLCWQPGQGLECLTRPRPRVLRRPRASWRGRVSSATWPSSNAISPSPLTSGLALTDSITFLDEVKEKINCIPAPRGRILKDKIEQVLKKNSNLKTLQDVAKVQSGISGFMTAGWSSEEVAEHKFCPFTAVDVELSFSIHKHIFNDRSHLLKEENLEKIVVSNCFYARGQ